MSIPPEPPYQHPMQGPPGPGHRPPQRNNTTLWVLCGAGALVMVLLFAGAIFFTVKVGDNDDQASASSSQSTDTSSETTTAETTTESTTPWTPPPPAPPPPTKKWIAATHNPATRQISWAISPRSYQEAQTAAQTRCGPGCPAPAWAEACVAIVIGSNNAWASDFGGTPDEALRKARAAAQNKHSATAPFSTWSKCSGD